MGKKRTPHVVSMLKKLLLGASFFIICLINLPGVGFSYNTIGEEDGVVKDYNGAGALVLEPEYKDGILVEKTSYRHWKDSRFKMAMETKKKSVEKAKVDGPVKYYYPSGELKREDEYNNNGLIVRSMEYDKNGKQTHTREYKYGENGRSVEYSYYLDIMQQETPFLNGVKDGLEKHYYDNGNVQWEREYKNGKWTGVRDFYENGKLMREGGYNDEENFGFVRGYDEDGNCIEESSSDPNANYQR